jgi:hypothetical protein
MVTVTRAQARRKLYLGWLWIRHRRERVVHKACFRVYGWLYYWGDYPGASHGSLLDGLRDACWIYVCGHGITFSLGIGWIYWKHLMGVRHCRERMAWVRETRFSRKNLVSIAYPIKTWVG